MKLYIKPGACSMASHIVLTEIGGDFAVEMVDTDKGLTAGGADYRAINPKGKVPALEVEGEVLTEGPAILQFLGDRAANLNLAPQAGSLARARVNEVLNFTGTELHIAFGPLFNPASTEAQKDAARAAVSGKLDWLEARLADGRAFLTGAEFTIADAYAFVVTNWANFTGISLVTWPRLAGFMARIAARPAVQKVLKAEGLAAYMARSGDFQGVAEVLAVYFDGLHFADSKRLATVFHPLAQYVCVTDGTLLYRDMASYFPVVDARISPASQGELRRDEIVSIEFAGPVTARAMLHCTIGTRFFTDFLTLIKLDGRWHIVSKVFHYVEEA